MAKGSRKTNVSWGCIYLGIETGDSEVHKACHDCDYANFYVGKIAFSCIFVHYRWHPDIFKHNGGVLMLLSFYKALQTAEITVNRAE